jgi:hypothetical protein
MSEQIVITTEAIKRLAMLLCTEEEAAGFFGISVSKFKKLLATDRKVRKAWRVGMESGKISLRRKQMRLASTSAAMAIFLGKNYLGQQDKVSNEISGKGGKPVEFTGAIRVEFVEVTDT